MTRILTLTALCALAASPTLAGGWETGKLDTSFLYEDGNYVELSYGSLDYSVNGTTQAGVTHPMATDQTRRSVSGKFQIGKLNVGITAFGSGAIQLDGQNSATSGLYVAGANNPYSNTNCDALVGSPGAATCNLSIVPSADVKVSTRAILGRYALNDSLSVLAGFREARLNSSTLTTLSTSYNIDAASKSGLVYGAAYEVPDYAMKFEVVRSEAIDLKVTGTATARPFATSAALGLGSVLPTGTSFDLVSSSLGVPEATTFNVQSGIAKDTLIMASAHHVKWKSAQIVATASGGSGILNNNSDFADSTGYSLGLGRKLSENTSASVTYSWEKGTGATSGSPFTLRDDTKTLSIGVKHTIDALSISGGVSYTKAGDVDVTHAPTSLTASYTGNSITAFGLKVGYSF